MKSPSSYCTSVNESDNLFSVNEGKRCSTLWYHSLKKHVFIFFVFLLSLRKFFNVVMISSCKQELAAINLKICYSQCLGQIRCRRIWTLFPLNLRCLVFPTMCVFIVLGIHLSDRTVMARVSLSAGSNFTDLWWVRRFWFDQVSLRIIGLQHRRYNNPGLCSYRPHGVKNCLPRRYCLKKIEKKRWKMLVCSYV